MSKIDTAVNWALNIANDSSHGYDQTHRWGPDYDCSSLLISAWQAAGVPVKSGGATYTGNMRGVFLRNGFSDVTNKINLSTGAGLQKGDVVLNIVHHTAMCINSSNHQLVMASINEKGTATGGKTGDQTGGEIKVRSYYNYPWNCVLRYTKDDTSSSDNGSASTGKLELDGSFGPATVRRTQEFLGTSVDGIVSNQPSSNKKYLYSAYEGCWEFKSSGYSQGSNMVRKLQKLIGATQDGWFGQASVKAFQKFLGVTQDGSMGPETVKAWQMYLNNH